MKKNACFLLSIFILISCSPKTTEPIYRAININPDEAKEISFENWFSEIELIPLETTDKSVFARCNKAIIKDGAIHIFDIKYKDLLVFDKSGKFIFSTKHKKGRGPEDCQAVTDFNVKDNTIIALDAINRKIISFNQQGEVSNVHFLNKQLLPLSGFEHIIDDIYLFESHDNEAELACYSAEDKKIFKRIGKYYHNYKLSTGKDRFYSIEDSLFFMYRFPSNTIYSVDKENLELTPRLKFNFGKKNLVSEDLPPNKEANYYNDFFMNPEYANLLAVKENKKYMFIHFTFNKKLFATRYNKSTSDMEICTSKPENRTLYLCHYIDSEFLYRVQGVDGLRACISEDLLTDSSKKIFQNLTISDNPVLIKYKLK